MNINLSSGLRSGQCPVCNSREIYSNIDHGKRGQRVQLIVWGGKWLFLDTYICIDCGHFEEYINNNQFDNSTKEIIRKERNGKGYSIPLFY